MCFSTHTLLKGEQEVSDNDFSSKIDRSVIDRMSIETLKGLIKDDFDSPNGMLDAETLLYITGVLAKKEEQSGNKAPDVEASLQKFKREYTPINENNSTFGNTQNEVGEIKLPKHKTRKKPVNQLLIAAAVIALMVTVTIGASAAGFNLWDTIVNWASETFGFNQQAGKSDEWQIPEQLTDIKNYLAEQAVSPKSVLPTYLSEKYTVKNTDFFDMEYYVLITCCLENGNSEIILQYKIYPTEADTGDSAVYQKDSQPPEEYVAGGIKHYITSNNGDWRCTWTSGNVECSISGVDSQEEIIKIIDSIYGE